MGKYRIRHIYDLFQFFLSIWLTGALFAGCSNADSPANLEPRLIIAEATDITRTSATLSVTIENPGTSTLSYIHFCYGEKGKTLLTSDNLKADKTVTSIELSNLKPGVTYSYYAEGGTSTATLRSETRTFTTIPNALPTISKPAPLSTGPTGIIVEFEIEDDGGEDITEAGCEVSDILTGTTRRIYLPKDKLKQGKHQIYITDLALQTSYLITPFASNSSGEALGEVLEYTTRNGIILHEAGTLTSLFGESPVSMKSLTISGDMNGDDFRFLRYLIGAPVLQGDRAPVSSVEEIYLSDVNIIEGGGTFDGSRFTENDMISTGIFADCKNLKSIVLPNSSRAIKHDAFARCQLLETFNIPIEVSELSPSSECPSLKSIQVSAANTHFSDIDGVVFNKDGTEILWFPLGKTGHFTLPSTLTSIGENAFMGTHITSLEIPSSVTTIHGGAFYGSALEEIRLPDNLKNISVGMFQNCTSLHCVRLGSGTEFIGNYAFDGTSLTSLYVSAQLPPYVSEDTFINKKLPIFDNCTLYVPTGYKIYYRNHKIWKLFNRIEEF